MGYANGSWYFAMEPSQKVGQENLSRTRELYGNLCELHDGVLRKFKYD